jgi:hypothetical protein
MEMKMLDKQFWNESLGGDKSGFYDELNASITNNFTGNLTKIEETEFVQYSLRPETYIVPILFGAIFIIGVIGNGTLIIVFLRHRAMRNVPNT